MDSSIPPPQPMNDTDTETTPAPAPVEQRPHGHPTLVAATVIAAIVGAAVAVIVLRGHPTEPSAPAGFTVNNGGVELLPSSPQWRYIDLAKTASGPPLAPVPAPGRVAVDEARSAPIYAPLAGRVERVDVQL